MPANLNTPRGPYQRQPHPLEPQIRELIAQGLNNTQIIEQLFAPPKVVARVRTDMGVPPAPRSTWRRKPHPKTREIHTLLEDGHNDAEIRRRTGADVRVIARMRTAGGYGKPTVTRKGRRHPREAEIRGLLAEHSTTQIAAMLGVDRAAVRRIRAEAGITYTAGSYATPREKWRARVQPVEGGHMEWTGERAKANGTPVMRFREKSYSPAAIAFEIQHGRPAEGYVRAECDYRQCVAPEHVNDEAGRRQARLWARQRNGYGDMPASCVYGHDMAEHGRLEADGRAYCGLCKRLDKQAQRNPAGARRARAHAATLEDAFRARTEPVDGGHLRWTGATSHGTPTVRFNGGSYSAYRVAFRLQHDREPQGRVTATCDMPGCVSGWHVADQPMRDQTDALCEAIFGEAA